MIPGGIAGLSLAILSLGGAIAFELADRHIQPAGVAASAPFARATTRNRAMPAQNDVDGRLSEILARPVFSPDRKPIGAGTKSIAGLSRLTGIVVTGTRKIAIFAAPSGGPPVIAEEGSHINAYEVTAINGSGVTVVGPNGTMVITPVFDAATSSAATSSPAKRSSLPGLPEQARMSRK